MFRDLMYFFTWRDLKVKYKQTIVGAAWAIFQPVAAMVVFSVIFGKLAKLPSQGAPYPIFVYSGLLFWNLFLAGLGAVSDGFVGNEKIITKIYFPKILLPLSALLTNFVDFLVATLVLVGLMIYYGYHPSWVGLALVPVLILMTIFSAIGIGLLFGSANVKYRDVRYILPFFMQLLIFITPVIYPITIISEKYRWILGLNPMSGVISAARSGLLGLGQIDWVLLLISAASMTVYCVLGYFYFKKTEQYFADVI
jgi:lipopolysaccharide transport system permease protein